MKAHRTSRAGRGIGIALVMAGGTALAACSPPTSPAPDPGTLWLAAGCIDSSIDLKPDFKFSGKANKVGNAVAFDNGGALSEDGTCTGTPVMDGTLVRAADQAGAITVCDDLGVTVTNPQLLVDHGYNAPIDAWVCVNGE